MLNFLIVILITLGVSHVYPERQQDDNMGFQRPQPRKALYQFEPDSSIDHYDPRTAKTNEQPKPRKRLYQFEPDDDPYADCRSSSRKDDIPRKQVQSHIKRYVNLFLRYSKLEPANMRLENDSNEVIYRTLNVKLTHEFIMRLQKMVSEEDVIANLADIDEILSVMFYTPYSERAEEFVGGTLSKFSFFHNIGASFTVFQYSIALAMCAASCIWYKFGLKKAFIFGLIVMTTIDAVQNYNNKIKLAEVKQYMELKKMQAVPPECDPATINSWTKVLNWFREDPCVRLYQLQQHESAADHVSFIECFMSTNLFVFMELPLKAFGESISAASSAIADGAGLGGFGRLLVYPAAVILVMIVYYCMGAWLLGSSVKLSWFLGYIQVGGRTTTPEAVPAAAAAAGATAAIAAAPSPVVNVYNIYKTYKKGISKVVAQIAADETKLEAITGSDVSSKATESQATSSKEQEDTTPSETLCHACCRQSSQDHSSTALPENSSKPCDVSEVRDIADTDEDCDDASSSSEEESPKDVEDNASFGLRKRCN